ncbi:hypothetical protein CKAH01_01729 [Colletotrichum kahawae]|uniref:Uncharacterized protein n=1 Tax=Colletotrichum kahawae TaxID=34407 RepID=A0AAD9Y464_COLKA|nr:hypothetical protein CKAH01_01729 [Colletotrichum kahawae]
MVAFLLHFKLCCFSRSSPDIGSLLGVFLLAYSI